MNRTITLVIAILLFPCVCKAQVEIFKTVEDYEENISTKYSGDVEYFIDFSFKVNPGSGIKIGIKDSITKIYFTDLWAFKYKNQFFRISNGDYEVTTSNDRVRRDVLLPVVLVSNGKMCYWENGVREIDFLRNGNEKKSTINFQNTLYFSSNIDSEIYNTSIKLKLFFKREVYRLEILNCFYNIICKDENDCKYLKKISSDELEQKMYVLQSYGSFSSKLKGCVEAGNKKE